MSDQRESTPRTVALPCAAPPFLAARAALPDPAPGGSSRGTMSMRKSNWSDLLRAFAMSARESVRRLFESAMMNARAVISAMKTCRKVGSTKDRETKSGMGSLSQALQNRIGAGTR